MTTCCPISNATDLPLPAGDREASRSEAEGGLGVRSLPKRQIEVTMFAAGVERLEGLMVGKFSNKTREQDIYQ